jgi:hypothetical protein
MSEAIATYEMMFMPTERERSNGARAPDSHVFEAAWHDLHDLSPSPIYQEASVFRERLMEDFSYGFNKFANPPQLDAFMTAPVRFSQHAQVATASRRLAIQDVIDYWQPVSVPSQPPPPKPGGDRPVHAVIWHAVHRPPTNSRSAIGGEGEVDICRTASWSVQE